MFNKETAIRTYNDKENKVEVISIIGNLTDDPVVRAVTTKKGEQSVISSFKDGEKRKSMTVATKQRDMKDEESVFIEYEIWGKAAEVFEKFAKKGTRVYFHGRYKEEPYTTAAGKEGLNRTVSVESFRLLSDNAAKVEGPKGEPEFTPVDDEDIPF